MAKCSECGFLAVWYPAAHVFLEASSNLRQVGKPEKPDDDPESYKAKCFIQKSDLAKELDGAILGGAFGYSGKVLEVITTPRDCDGHIEWIQGFDPKERREMLRQDEMRKSERFNSRISLGVAVVGSLMTAGITYMSANLEADATRESAKWQIEAQLKTTEMQIQAQVEIAKQEASKPSQPINVTVQLPEAKERKK